MPSNLSSNTLALLSLSLAFCVQGTLGKIACETLDHGSCAFAVSSAGKRCVLEKQVRRSGEEVYTCRSSEIEANNRKDYVETDGCIDACRLDRKTLGISSDSLHEPSFTESLCSDACYQNCPNIVDLYFSLAAGEGVFLPKLCDAQRVDLHRGMAEITSSGGVASERIQPMSLGVTAAAAPCNDIEG